MTDKEILKIKHLKIDFQTENGINNAVKDISFSLKKGETLGIVGETGSGKSVTAMSIMRLLQQPPAKISNGEILYSSSDNKYLDLLKLNNKEMRHYRGNEISMIFQEPMTSLNPVMKCGKQVTETILLHKKFSKQKAKLHCLNLFKEVMLPTPENIFNSYPHQLSGGQKQRVMIAMAMSCEPNILIADEPTTALDVTVQKTILQLMKNLQKKYNTSIIFITHDLGVINEIADRVLIMYNGEIVEEANVKDIFKNPKHPYTKGLLACRPPLNKRYEKLAVVNDFLNSDDISFKEISAKERKISHEKIYAKEPLLQIRNLKTYFNEKKSFFKKNKGNIKAVDDVSFEVYPGEILGLVGESGCGKTTLGRTILQLIKSQGGEVIYKGTDLCKLNNKKLRNLRKEIQIIFQDPYSSLNPIECIGNAIMEPMQVHGLYKNKKERMNKVFQLLEKVNLKPEYFYRYPHELSGGQRQRICIARALALNPDFIICDESVSALDVSVQAQVLNILNKLKKDFSITYIFISHDLSVVKYMSDRMIVMKQGKIVEAGDADDIYYNPKEKYTKTLIEAIPKCE
ncbi:MAG: ABC transporter ATP-binding protein [Bacteroidales bacterium]|nr:ABC transporter ATP-binding protein [Bacteroidales bacterium]